MNRPEDQIIKNVISGLASQEEAQNVAQWFATREGSDYLSEMMDQDMAAIKEGTEELFVNHDIPSQEIYRKIQDRIRRRTMRRLIFRAASIVFPLIIVAGMFYYVQSKIDIFGTPEYQEIYVPKGEKMQMAFQDGTKVYLNSDTRLKYPTKFSLSSRDVYLNGEAYFEVAKNKDWQFNVHLSDASIKVLGTSFNVNSYNTASDITVLLESGSIAMSIPAQKDYVMIPGDKLTYDKLTKRCTLTHNSSTKTASEWRKNILTFNDATLEEVANTLTRTYNIAFRFNAKNSSMIRFTISTDSSSIQKTLIELEKISPLKFSYDEARKEVVVTDKK